MVSLPEVGPRPIRAQGSDNGGVTGGVTAAMRQILSYVSRYPGTALVIVLLIAVDVAFNTALALSLQFLIDHAITPRDRTVLLIVIVGLVAGFFIVTISQIWRDRLYAWLGARVLHDLRIDIFEHLQRLSLGFFARSKLGDLLARFSTDIGAVENAIVFGIATSVYALLHVAVSILILFVLEWRLALIVLVGLPFCLIGPRIFGPRALRAGYRFRTEQAALASTIEEQISAQSVVKAFDLKEMVRAKVRTQSDHVVALASRFNFLSSVAERSPNITMLALGIIIICGGGVMVFDGALSIGALVSFNLLFVTISTYVESLTSSVPTLLQAAGGMQRINEILAERPAVVERASARPLTRLSQGVAFDRVSFGYGESSALSDVSLQVPRGSKAAFVGPSGSGKSTIIRLLMRFYDPQAGRVLIDGIDLREAQLSTLYGQIGIVFQENFLFNTSVRENIRLGKPTASDAEIERAARDAELDPAAMGPLGYDTIVGERGGRLSGGQRQRVAIARALIRDPTILILDEATSSLDPPAVAAINDTLARLARNRTVIAVTHRLDDVTEFDRIFVLGNGRLLESGTHPELLARNGAYTALWRG
jgi:ATP-binding cassette, subfamily B, bacterial